MDAHGDGDGDVSFREAAGSLADWLLGERFLANTTRFGDSPPILLRDPNRAIFFTLCPPYRYGTRYIQLLISLFHFFRLNENLKYSYDLDLHRPHCKR